jgi:hypothetical protein
MEALGTVSAGDAGGRIVVVLDRFDGHHDLHRRNRQWLVERDHFDVVTLPGEEQRLAELVTSG